MTINKPYLSSFSYNSVLHLVNNQGMVWMGMFFSPGLALINLVKLGILMYLRSWTVLTCNVPHEVVFRASRSNNFYLALLLTMLFLCVLPVSYAIVLLTPSWHCGPFSDHDKIYYLFTNATMDIAPDFLKSSIHYLASPAAVIPLLVLLILIIYYLLSLTGSLREANHDLRNQLRKERTEERKKMWKLAEEQTKGPTNGANTLVSRWKKVLEGAQSPSPENAMAGTVPDTKVEARKDLLAKIMKKALRKGSASDDDSQVTNVGDETDTEAHESLPRDHSPITKIPDVKPRRKLKNPFAQIIAMAKEKAVKETQEGVENQENKENIRKEIEGDIKQEQPDTKKTTEDQEADEKERIVSERRRSLFKRQENTGATAVDIETEHPDKKSKAPDLIFKFDESLAQTTSQTADKQSDPNEYTSKKSKPEKPKRNGANIKHRCSPHHEITSDSSSDYPATTAEQQKEKVETPHYAAPMKIRPVTEKPVSPGPDGKYSKKKEVDHVEKKYVEKKETTDETKPSPSKPKRKFNKFFALEKDGKFDVTSPKSPKSPKSPTVEPIPENPAVDNLQKQESLSSKDSVESSSKDSKTDKKTTKRQDSQTSIWSDKIPVITISKTESNENILEEGSGTIKKKKSPKKSEQ